jgi:thiamine-monophosphate kinase
MTLGDLGERGFIERIQAQNPLPSVEGGLRVGIGDDTAAFDVAPGLSQLFCSDLLVEDTHFLRELHPPDSIAYKAIAANVSDIGAMGGMPRHFLLSFAAPPSLDLGWIDSFISGLKHGCMDFDVSLLGGDSSSSKQIFVDVCMIGVIPAGKCVLRSGARSGDGIYVTGRLGASVLGLERLRKGETPDDPAIQRHLYPAPRHAVGQAVLDMAHAMIDVSDGLSTDLAHILVQSRVSARIYKDRVPGAPGASENQVLHGGEEYELIIIAPDLPPQIAGVPVTRIGEIMDSVHDHIIVLVDGAGESRLLPAGWQHF